MMKVSLFELETSGPLKFSSSKHRILRCRVAESLVFKYMFPVHSGASLPHPRLQWRPFYKRKGLLVRRLVRMRRPNGFQAARTPLQPSRRRNPTPPSRRKLAVRSKGQLSVQQGLYFVFVSWVHYYHYYWLDISIGFRMLSSIVQGLLATKSFKDQLA